MSVALFMVVLDNLVVSVALPTIHRDLGASIQSLEWTVNAYVLAYAVLLLTGAALGDRFGRKRMFLIGMSVFTAASALAALAPSTGLLVAARAVQGAGAAIVTPLTLTLLAEAFPAESRGMAIGVWSGISGIAVALGPLVGGAVVQGISWHWIFWINVPIGLVPDPARGARAEREPRPLRHARPAPASRSPRAACSGSSSASCARSRSAGQAPTVLVCLIAGAALLGGFVAWELRTREPMLPMSFFARALVRGHERRLAEHVLRHVRLDLLPLAVHAERARQHAAPGRPEAARVDRRDDGRGAARGRILRASRQPPVHGRRPRAAGGRAGVACEHAVQRDLHYSADDRAVHHGRRRHGAGVRALGERRARLGDAPQQAGQASGANNAIREVGGVLGVAVLASVFTGAGGYGSAQAFIDGLQPGAVGRGGRARAPARSSCSRCRSTRAAQAAPAGGWRQRPRRSARGGAPAHSPAEAA